MPDGKSVQVLTNLLHEKFLYNFHLLSAFFHHQSSPFPIHLNFKLEKLFLRSDNAMKMCIVKKPTIVNRFGLQTRRLALIPLKTTGKKLENLKHK